MTELTLAKGDTPFEIQRHFEQCTWEEVEPPDGTIISETTDGPHQHPDDHSKRRCRKITEREFTKSRYAHYCVQRFKARKVRSAWWYVGLVAGIVGFAALTVITCGAFAGAAFATGAAAGVIATAAAAVGGTGVGIMVAVPPGWEAGDLIDTKVVDEKQDIPPQKLRETQFGDWYDC